MILLYSTHDIICCQSKKASYIHDCKNLQFKYSTKMTLSDMQIFLVDRCMHDYAEALL